MKARKTEVLVIGSGFGAAPVAMRLAEAGIDVTMIEKGPAIDPYSTFKQTQNPKYLTKYLKTIHGKNVSINFVEGEGGGSGFFELMTFRAPSSAFLQKDKNANALWPAEINRQTLDPYYDIAEDMLHIHQVPQKHISKNGQLFQLMMSRLGLSTDRIKHAVEHCMDCGRCLTGCIYGAKQSLLVTYLPRAREAGMQLYTGMQATKITTRAASGFRYCVETRDELGERTAIHCKALVLAGGTVGTASLLLRSKDELPLLSPELGRNLTFTGSVKMASFLPPWSPDGDLYVGRSHPGVVSYAFHQSHGLMVTPVKPLPLQVAAIARIRKMDHDPHGYWGQKHVELMRKLRNRGMFLVAFGFLPPTGKLWVQNGSTRIAYDVSSGKEMYRSAKKVLQDIVIRSGGEILELAFMGPKGVPRKNLHFTTSHPLGTCRMSDRLTNGVVNKDGEVFGYPGMYISDGSILPSSLGLGPSLTILALGERIADRMLAKYGLSHLATASPLKQVAH